MNLKFSKETLLFLEITGVITILLGFSYHGPLLIIYILKYMEYLSSLDPHTFGGRLTKPDFPDLPSLTIVLPFVFLGTLMILVSYFVKKTFPEK